MKTYLIVFCLFVSASVLRAQDFGLYWKYKDYEGVSLTVPSFAIDIGSWFVKEEAESRLIRKINKVRIMYFENGSPVKERDLQRFDRKAKRRGLEDLLYVRQGKMHVRVLAKERGNAIRKIVVLMQSPREFAMVSVRGRFHWDDISRIIDKYGKAAKKDGKSLMPPAVKVPVSKI